MMKSLILAVVLFSTTTALADSNRLFSTQNLECLGKAATGETTMLDIKSSGKGGKVIVDGFYDFNTHQLRVVSEGNVAIQVNFGDLINLFLTGPALSQVLEGPIGATAVALTGSISFKGEGGKDFDLECKGDLTSEAFDSPAGEPE